MRATQCQPPQHLREPLTLDQSFRQQDVAGAHAERKLHQEALVLLLAPQRQILARGRSWNASCIVERRSRTDVRTARPRPCMGACVDGTRASPSNMIKADAFHDRPRAGSDAAAQAGGRELPGEVSAWRARRPHLAAERIDPGSGAHADAAAADIAGGAHERLDQLPTPFRAVATDLESGETVVMGSGDLTSAMRASLSAPGCLRRWSARGACSSTGASPTTSRSTLRAHGCGPGHSGGCRLSTAAARQLSSAPVISSQMLAILIQRNAQAQLATLTAQDILIQRRSVTRRRSTSASSHARSGWAEAAARGRPSSSRRSA